MWYVFFCFFNVGLVLLVPFYSRLCIILLSQCTMETPLFIETRNKADIKQTPDFEAVPTKSSVPAKITPNTGAGIKDTYIRQSLRDSYPSSATLKGTFSTTNVFETGWPEFSITATHRTKAEAAVRLGSAKLPLIFSTLDTWLVFTLHRLLVRAFKQYWQDYVKIRQNKNKMDWCTVLFFVYKDMKIIILITKMY